MTRTITTRNIKHPNTFSIYKGETSVVSDLEAINQSIRLILLTAKGELFGDPDFGSNLYSYLYDNYTPMMDELIRYEIVKVLNEQEPRVSISSDDIEIKSRPNDLTLEIEIKYRLRYSDLYGTYSLVTSTQEVV